MDKYAKVREALLKIIQDSGIRSQLWQAEVVSIEGDTCTVLVGNLELSDVRLKAIVGETDGTLLVTPAVGSVVLVGSLTGDFKDLAVLQVDKFTELRFDGDAFGGMVKATELVKRLNALENDINTLKNVFAAWVSVPQDGGAALKAATATWAGQTLEVSQQNALENTKIVHG